jgi:hypothetical protein
MTNYYETNMQHILEELKRIDLMIYQQIQRIRQKIEDVDEFRGLYISEEEIDAILYNTYPANDADQHIQTLVERIAELEQEIAEKKGWSLRRGVTLNLPQLAIIFGLTPFELDVVLICMAPELDTKYERLYGYMQNDATKKQPSVDFLPIEDTSDYTVKIDLRRMHLF